jgi:5-methylcytosine-specific restriction endonuclease McrA
LANPPRTTSAYGVPVEHDAAGFPLCRQCKGSIRTGKRPKQRTFCGPECVHLWKLRSDPGYQAIHVLERDKGVCALCGLDCLAALAELKALLVREAAAQYGADKYVPANYAALRPVSFPEFHERCDQLGLSRHERNLARRLWEMDHIVPVIEGGGSCGLENLRTLCVACHRKETAALAARRAEARKAVG